MYFVCVSALKLEHISQNHNYCGLVVKFTNAQLKEILSENHNYLGNLFQRTQISQFSKFDIVFDNQGAMWQRKQFSLVFYGPNRNWALIVV
jgi:hypothetical protein